MPLLFVLLAPASLFYSQANPDHAHNSVYSLLTSKGWDLKERTIPFPQPLTHDQDGAERFSQQLEELAGSKQAATELLRDSVTAPYVIKVHDVKLGQATVRMADLWFVVRGDLDALDPARQARESEGKRVAAANMEFQIRLLQPEAAANHDRRGSSGEAAVWFTHVSSRLLGRIQVEATNRVEVTRTAESIVAASITDPSFKGTNATGWRPIDAESIKEASLLPYPGGASYTRISRLKGFPGALLVESHLAFVEPDAWFQGAPILRSKLSIIAQDQIRKLRRDLVRIKARGSDSPAGASSADKPHD